VNLHARVLRALDAVFDPELDEPVTALGFVSVCHVDEAGGVTVRLRLPTPQCAPNFAFLMAADARAAIAGVPGVGAVRVELEDHFTGREINAAVAQGGAFATAFPGETEGELDALRALFRRKALLAREGRLLWSVPDPAAARLGDLEGEDAERCRALRQALGIDAGDDAPAFVTGDGTPLGADDVTRFARMAGLTALSLETNGGICRDLLRVRYPDAKREEVAV
jgi:metal-sulfur cluster biosynthetic enzyme